MADIQPLSYGKHTFIVPCWIMLINCPALQKTKILPMPRS